MVPKARDDVVGDLRFSGLGGDPGGLVDRDQVVVAVEDPSVAEGRKGVDWGHVLGSGHSPGAM